MPWKTKRWGCCREKIWGRSEEPMN
ncbi:hypothetical protein OIU76_004279 [Salix suchowensis]|nr:hypothetical protein OIU76_004279 [Salix suchowensis]